VKQPYQYSAEDFQRDTGVSRETLDRLRAYADLLVKWNPKINLVGPSTIPELWWRHMFDSAQLRDSIPSTARVAVDLGSGAGFPGLVLAIMTGLETHLIESDVRKVAFLRESARATKTTVTIHQQRIESVDSFKADVVTARACAPLSQLLEWAIPFMGSEAVGVFPKGQNVGSELTEAHKIWTMNVDQRPSRTDPTATILCVREVKDVRASASPE
jgi:16S rRNA (guanine527-N7)-methyltransferase